MYVKYDALIQISAFKQYISLPLLSFIQVLKHLKYLEELIELITFQYIYLPFINFTDALNIFK